MEKVFAFPPPAIPLTDPLSPDRPLRGAYVPGNFAENG